MAFIDGYNLYHAIDEMDVDQATRRHSNTKHHLKWTDLKALVNAFLKPSKEELVGVMYFSAFATWLPDSHARHRSFVNAIEHSGVTVVLGRFKKRPKKCKACRTDWIEHEEKETDVNVALHLLDCAHRDMFDKAVVITADTDIAPALEMVRARFPEKLVHGLVPLKRFKVKGALEKHCHQISTFHESHLERNQLPEKIELADGSIIQRPEKYALPKAINKP